MCVHIVYCAGNTAVFTATTACKDARKVAQNGTIESLAPWTPGFLDAFCICLAVLESWTPRVAACVRHAAVESWTPVAWIPGLLLRCNGTRVDANATVPAAMAPGSTPTPRCLLQWRQGRRQRRGAYCRSLPRIPGILDSYCRGAFCVAAWLKS